MVWSERNKIPPVNQEAKRSPTYLEQSQPQPFSMKSAILIAKWIFKNVILSHWLKIKVLSLKNKPKFIFTRPISQEIESINSDIFWIPF